MTLTGNKDLLLLFVTFAVAISLHTIMANSTDASTSPNYNVFAADLFTVVVDNSVDRNVVFSPASIQTCLIVAYLGAEGETAEEMRNALKLGEGDKNAVIKKYAEFVKSSFKSTNPQGGPLLKIANRVFANHNLKISGTFQKLAKEYFGTTAKLLNFANAAESVAAINGWVEEQTNKKIQNLLQEDAVNSDTSAILVNAIYFKAKWTRQFSESSTRKSTFYTLNKDQVHVDLMYQDDYFRYADLPEFDATALEMQYENSDLSMLIILPREVDGLQNLESKLSGFNISQIAEKMEGEHVDVFLPRFRIEFDIDLKEPLKKMGITSMFSSNANLAGLFVSSVPQKISEVKHKAFLDVNEAGSEAAAATYLKIVPMSLNLNQKVFRVDHPFFFAIRDKTSVYFSGHVVKP
uniref:Serine protease inhibitor (serpin) 3 n=1 Tax=Glossina morsitans morsitans TaxID=37546 RepID=Q2PQQ1_GLOMM|nr:serine protease inhibitor 1 [Glossina morsitans morsitans]